MKKVLFKYMNNNVVIEKYILFVIYCEVICTNVLLSGTVYDNIKWYATAFLSIILVFMTSIKCFVLCKNENKINKFNFGEMVLYLWVFWIVILNIWKHNSTIDLLLPYLSIACTYGFIKYNTTKDKANDCIEKMLYIICILVIFQSFIGLVQYLESSLLSFDYANKIKTVVVGTINYPNGYGSFIAVGIPCLIYFLRKLNSKISKLLLLLSLIFAMCSLILNGSRGAMLCMLISAILTYSIYQYKIMKNDYYAKKICKLLFFCIIILLIGSFLYYLNLESSNGRIMIHKITGEIIGDHMVFGVGVDNYQSCYLSYQGSYFETNPSLSYKATEIQAPLNMFLKEFCENGILGGGLYVLLVFTIILSVCRLKIQEIKNKEIYILIMYMSFFFFLHSMFEDLIDIWAVYFPVFAFLCFALQNIKSYIACRNFVCIPVLLSVCLLCSSISYIVNYPSLESLYQSRKEYSKGQYNKSFEIINKVCTPNSNKYIKTQCGISLIALNRDERGIEILEEVVTNYQSKHLYLGLCLAYYRLRKYDKALEYAYILERLFPDQLRAKLMIGLIYYAKNEKKKAIPYLEKCVNLETYIKNSTTKKLSQMAKLIIENNKFDINCATSEEKLELNSLIMAF